MSQQIRAYVEQERTALLKNEQGVAGAVITRPHRGMTVALGLLSLGDVQEGKQWLRALSDEWIIYADEKLESKYKEEPRSPASPGPWGDYVNAVFSSLLAVEDVEKVAEIVFSRTTDEFVDKLEKREFAHDIGLARILSGHLTKKSGVSEHTTQLESNVHNSGGDWEIDRYSAYSTIIRGLQKRSKPQVSSGIENLLTFHREHVIGSPDADLVQKVVATDATAMLALARREGMNLTIEHDAIPDALNDDDHYPVGE